MLFRRPQTGKCLALLLAPALLAAGCSVPEKAPVVMPGVAAETESWTGYVITGRTPGKPDQEMADSLAAAYPGLRMISLAIGETLLESDGKPLVRAIGERLPPGRGGGCFFVFAGDHRVPSPELDASHLDGAIRQVCGQRPTAIVLSGCYAGAGPAVTGSERAVFVGEDGPGGIACPDPAAADRNWNRTRSCLLWGSQRYGESFGQLYSATQACMTLGGRSQGHDLDAVSSHILVNGRISHYSPSSPPGSRPAGGTTAG